MWQEAKGFFLNICFPPWGAEALLWVSDLCGWQEEEAKKEAEIRKEMEEKISKEVEVKVNIEVEKFKQEAEAKAKKVHAVAYIAAVWLSLLQDAIILPIC